MEENKLFVPVYHELVDKMKAGIRSGDLSGKLPGVRVLGRQFGVNPATISKALRVLEEKEAAWHTYAGAVTAVLAGA